MTLKQMMTEIDEKLQNVINEVDVMEARNDDYMAKIESNYNEDGKDELIYDDIRKVVLNGTTLMAIANASCSAHYCHPTISTCRR